MYTLKLQILHVFLHLYKEILHFVESDFFLFHFQKGHVSNKKATRVVNNRTVEAAGV